jgi:hypothetical protein
VTRVADTRALVGETGRTMILPLHFGSLHPVEQALVVLLAFGPFILLGVIVFVIRRRDIAEEEREQADRGFPEDEGPGRSA